MNATLKQIDEAKKTLTSAGWEHAYSVMSGDRGDRKYGLVFLNNNGEKFYLNHETLGHVAALRAQAAK
jgi:hypothetical protein